MRIDKFLKNARIIKRRSVSKEACDQGRVLINGQVAKAGMEVKVGDEITIQFGNNPLTVEVLVIKETVRKEEAEDLYRVKGDHDA